MMLSRVVGLVPVATAGFDVDTDGVFDEQRILVAWLFGAIIMLIAISSAFVVRRRTETRWVRWLAVQGVLGMAIAVVIGALPNDRLNAVNIDGERRGVLCGPILNFIRADPPECGDQMEIFTVVVRVVAVISVVLLAVARVFAYVEHRGNKRAMKRERTV